MLKKILLIISTIVGVAAFFQFPAFSAPPEEVRECPVVPPDLRDAVQRTLASKPEDLFVVLKNGLTLLIHQQPGSEVVSTQVFVRAGSMLEGKYLRAGLSHYLEHVVAGGSTHSFSETEVKERIRAMGGTTNAYTTYDRTVYYINAGADHWRDTLDILLSYVSENKLDPKEVTREKAVIQQEMKMGEANASSELWKLFIQTAYQRSPVRIPVIGNEESFIQISKEALQDYYQQRYQPENMIVVISGTVPPVEALRFVVQKTAGFRSKPSEPVTLPDEPLQTSARWEEREIPVTRLVQAKIGFPTVNAYDRDVYALDVLAHLLGEGETCRLYCRLKDQENKVYSIGATHWSPAFVRGQFIVSVSLDPSQWPGALKEIQEEITGFKTALVSGPDLEKAKKNSIARQVFGRETTSAMAGSLAYSYMVTGDPYYDDQYIDGIRSVTAEEIRSVAERYLVPERMSVAVIKPSSTEQIPVKAAALPSCPVPQDEPTTYTKAANGLKVLLKRDTTLPFVTMHLFGTGGLVLEDPSRPGISAFTAGLLTAGTRTRTRMELLKKVEDAGGIIGATSDNNTYHISMKVLREDFDWAVDLLADIVQNSQFPPEEIEKHRQDTLIAIRRADENWQSEVMRLFKKNYFQHRSYANDRLGTAESVKAFTREDILAFYKRMVNPTHSALAVFGDIDPAKTEAVLAGKFAGWSGTAVQQSLTNETSQIRENRRVEKKNEKNSAALFIGANGIDVNSPVRPVLDVLSSILSGGGGRMFDALRGGDKDLVYTVHSVPFYGRNAGFFGVITQTTMANLEKVQEIVLSNLKRLAQEPVPPEEFARAKQSMLVGMKLGKETLDSQASSAALNEVVGLGWDYDKKYPDLIRAVTPEQVRELAGKLFQHTLIARTLPERPVEILAAPPPVKTDVQM